MRIKKILIIIFSIFSLILFLNFSYLKSNIKEKYPNIGFIKYLFKKESLLNKINNDYNIKFLPNTEFVKLNFIKKKLVFDETYYKRNFQEKTIHYSQWGTFFLEIYKQKLIIGDYKGNLYFIDYNKDFILKKDSINLNLIKNNLKIARLFDILVNDEKIYASYSRLINECNKSYVAVANIDLKELEFTNIFETDCSLTGVTGKLKIYKADSKEGILVTTSSGEYNNPDQSAQDLSSIYGKIIFLDFKEKNKKNIFSLGHRVIQGLYVENNLIIATEHGPRGGDEINKIKYGKNYGWPISSYGEKYDFDYEKKSFYKKEHKQNNFEEPIFYFIPSLGISEIKRLDDKFSLFLKNQFVIATLNGRSILFAKFDENFSKLMSYEKVFLNQRVRDLEYHTQSKSILLALEENGELGIITSN